MRWVEHAACMREMRNAYKILVGNPKRNRPFKTTYVDLKEIGLENVD
jgi:hypothetical protein